VTYPAEAAVAVKAVAVRGYVHLVRRGSTAFAAQGINSLSNLMVAVVVARSLGPSALGRFSLLFTILLTFVSLQTAWVGDSLTVLDRLQPAVRRGIATSQWLHVLLGMTVGGLLAHYVAGVDVFAAAAFAVLVAVWELEEFGRRTFMARLEFWKQAANDGSYLVITAGSIAAWSVLGSMSLASILVCMAIGAIGAFVLGMAWLPSEERLQRPVTNLDGFAEVARYGGWRAAESGWTYTGQVVVKSLVIAVASAAVMGQIEAARLVAAPLFTLTGALANVSLASIARAIKAKRSLTTLLRATALACGGVGAIYSAVVLSFASTCIHLLAGVHFQPDVSALRGWLLFAVVTSICTPFNALALVVARIRVVFCFQATGTMIGVALGVAAVGVAHPSLVPACLACGSAFAGGWLWWLGRRAVRQGAWLNE